MLYSPSSTQQSFGSNLETVVTPSDKVAQGDGTLPAHVAQAISALQREVLLLRNDLNLELWTARENVAHIGRLYKDRVLSRNEEAERQGLVSGSWLRMLIRGDAQRCRSITSLRSTSTWSHGRGGS